MGRTEDKTTDHGVKQLEGQTELERLRSEVANLAQQLRQREDELVDTRARLSDAEAKHSEANRAVPRRSGGRLPPVAETEPADTHRSDRMTIKLPPEPREHDYEDESAMAMRWAHALDECAAYLKLRVGNSLAEDVPREVARLVERLQHETQKGHRLLTLVTELEQRLRGMRSAICG